MLTVHIQNLPDVDAGFATKNPHANPSTGSGYFPARPGSAKAAKIAKARAAQKAGRRQNKQRRKAR